MLKVSKTELIERFLAKAKPWVAGGMTTRELIVEFVAFYREIRVVDVDPKEGDRLFLYSNGSSSNHLLDGPKNLIDASDSDLAFSTQQYCHVGLSRELWPPEGDWDEEEDEDDDIADESGVGLSLFMYFDPPADPNLSSNDFTLSPKKLEKPLAIFLQRPLVVRLLDTRPMKITAFASRVG